MTRKVSLVMTVALLAACSKGDREERSDSKDPTPQPRVEEAFDPARPEAVPTDQPGKRKALSAHLNLQNLAHLADVDHEGLFVDFGTPSAAKYTVGGWNTGWGKDGVDGDTHFTYVASNTGRLYVPIEVAGDALLRFRLKPIGTGTMQIYLNNKPLPLVHLDKTQGFREYDVPMPAAQVKSGENYLLLRFGDTTKVNGQDVSVAVDWMRVVPRGSDEPAQTVADKPAQPGPKAATTEGYRPPRYAQLVQNVAIGGSQRRALRVDAPTRLSWYVQVPEAAELSFRVGLAKKGAAQAKATVTATPQGGAAEQVFSNAVGETWTDALVSLSKFSGKLVRLDFAAGGAGSVAWSSPSIMVPEVTTPPLKQSKNTVVLLIDTLRASKLRTYNRRSGVKTPVLDQIAAEGTVFESAQAPENWTKPSVASVLTALYPLTHNTKRTESKLPQSALMVSEVFKKAGFKTASFLANGYVSNKFGFDQGWDHYTNYIREGRSTEAENVFREAIKWIKDNKDQRFFVYIQTIDPHVPYDPPKEFLDMYDPADYGGQVSPRKTPDLLEKAKRNPPKVTFSARDRKRLEALHDGEISYHDKHLGEFIARLKKLGLYEDMAFVVTSDHGEEFYEHGSYGHGHSVYQEMIHVPWIMRQPGVVPAGKRIRETVGTLDISPTVLTAAGVPVPKEMEGISRMDHVRGKLPPGPSVAFSDFLDDRHVVRAGRWKLVLRGSKATLFDLAKDPGEQTELDYRKYPVAMRYCRTMLGQFLGADSKGNWLAAGGGTREALKAEDTDIDSETRDQLKALGYAN
ncbi:MAG: sulfatase [Myxococcales bacterium]|nr:sulfatase [Myxococcales bacterium]